MPMICGMVRITPWMAPEVAANALLGPGVKAAVAAIAKRAIKFSDGNLEGVPCSRQTVKPEAPRAQA